MEELLSDATGVDARELAAMVGGVWETPPNPAWRFRGVCFAPARYRQGQMIVCRTQGARFRYGVEFHELKTNQWTFRHSSRSEPLNVST